MKRRFSDEQIIGMVKEYEAGVKAQELCRKYGSYRFPDHEQRLGQMAEQSGFTQVSLSHEVSLLIKFVGRGNTAVVDAYLSPILRRYVDQVANGSFREGDLLNFPKLEWLLWAAISWAISSVARNRTFAAIPKFEGLGSKRAVLRIAAFTNKTICGNVVCGSHYISAISPDAAAQPKTQIPS